MEKISFCIPCYNSGKTIEKVIEDIKTVVSIRSAEYEYEIVCVVDGSPDNVYQVLSSIAKDDKTVKVINLSKNFGQPGARMASLKYATGDYIVCLDDDGQCPIENLWPLMEHVVADSDVAIAKYPRKKQSAFKNFGSWFNSKTIQFLLDVPKDYYFSNFWVMKRFVSTQILKYDNPFPYLTGLISEITTSIAYVEMEEHERIEGKTNYTLKKLINSWLNGALNFSVKPLRFAVISGFICAIIGFIVAIYSIIIKIMGADINVGYTSIFSAIFIVGGIQMLLLGMMGEYIGRTFISINNVPQFVVREHINVSEVCNDTDNN